MEASSSARQDTGHGARLLAGWKRMSSLPGGAWAFSRMVGRIAPYTATIGARVLRLEPGQCDVQLRDRRHVRNHLRSVHAIALANLGEMASGLAALAGMPDGVRGIPTRITIDYTKKARGTLTAHGSADLPDVQAADGKVTAEVDARITDDAGDVVAHVRVQWALERVS